MLITSGSQDLQLPIIQDHSTSTFWFKIIKTVDDHKIGITIFGKLILGSPFTWKLR